MRATGRRVRRLLVGLSLAAAPVGALEAATVAAGAAHTAVIRASDGSLWVWGANHRHQLGDGSAVPSPTPQPVAGITGVVAVASGDDHLLALTAGGQVLAWGANDSGQVGDGTNQDRSVPVSVLSGAVGISAGPNFSLAWAADGTLWAWGANDHGQLGDGTIAPSNTPVALAGVTNVLHASAGRGHVVALTASGEIWGWGRNDLGQLATGDQQERYWPTLLAEDPSIVRVVAGDRASYAVVSDGTVLSVGANDLGQLGCCGDTWPDPTPYLTHVQTPATLGMAAGAGHVLARVTNAAVWAWGRNDLGQVGDGTQVHRPLPVTLGLSAVADVGAGVGHSVAVTADGVVWTWGRNGDGQLGDGGAADSPVPQAISGPDFAWKVGRPLLVPPGGTYHAVQTVTISTVTAGATLRYTIDGTDPHEASPSIVSGETVSIDVPTILKVRAVKTGQLASDLVTAAYSLRPPDVAFTPPGGPSAESLLVTLSSAGADEIRYTVDGSEPAPTSALYTSPIGVSQSTGIKARGYKSGWDPGEVTSHTYVFGAETPVQWTALAGVTATANALQKPAGSGEGWNAGAVSTKAIVSGDGWVEVVVKDAAPYWAFGLSHGNSGEGYGDIDFGLGIVWGGSLYLIEDGLEQTSLGSVVWGDRLRVAVEAGVVKYFRNGQEIATSATAPRYPLLVDTSIYGPGGRISDAVIFGLLGDVVLDSPGTPVAWTDAVGVSAAGASVVKGSNGEEAWDSGAVSTKAISSGDGWVDAVVEQPYSFWAIGLSQGNSGQGYGDIDFGLAVAWGELLYALESGVQPTLVGEVRQGDHLRVTIEGGVVKYFRNGTQVWQSTTTPSYPLLVDTSIYEPGGKIAQVTIAGLLEDVSLEGPGIPVTWTSLVRVTADANNLQKTTGGSSSWNAGAVSTQTISSGEGWVDADVAEDLTYWAFGLSQGDSSQGYADIDFALGIWGTELWVVENGVDQAFLGEVAQGDRLRVQVDAGIVKYFRNGKQLWSSSAAPGYPLLVDTSILLQGARIRNVTMKLGGEVPSVAAPAFDPPAGGPFCTALQVAVSTATPDATIRYTLDGAEPSEASPLVPAEGVPVSETLTLRAKAWKEGHDPSPTTTGSYQVGCETLASPVISPASGTYDEPIQATITGGPLCEVIRFTTDGSPPTTGSSVYTAPINVAGSSTVKAACFKPGYTASPHAEATYLFQVQPPLISPPGGTFDSEVEVSISSTTSGATIRYTTDGSEPTEASTVLDAGETISLDVTTTIRARAWRVGFAPSPTSTEVFEFEAAVPRANPPAGTYVGVVHVGLACQTSEAEIRYTTDGTEPTSESALYVGPLVLTTTTTLKTRAFRGPTGSAVANYSFNVTAAVGEVAGGQAFSLALAPTGDVWAWGAGDAGQLGNGMSADSTAPLKVADVTDAKAIAAFGTRALALRADGTILTWGDGQLAPVAVNGLDSAIAIAAGGAHSLALRGDGRVYSWGDNTYGQLGDGTTESHAVPAVVSGLTNVIAIAAGEAHSLALGADGRLWAWGDNGWGQIGDASGSAQPAPVEILTDAVAVGAGSHHSFAVKSDGSGWAWGRNDHGQLSTIQGSDDTVPSLVEQGVCEVENSCSGASFPDVGRFAGGTTHSIASSQGGVWSAGANQQGQLGRSDDWSSAFAMVSLSNVVAFAAGADHSLAVTTTGEVWAWGDNAAGQLGDCTSNSAFLPRKVAAEGLTFLGCQPPPAPTFNVAGGTFATEYGIAVAISSPGQGVVIRYTTDESDPGETDTAINSGDEVWIDASVTLKARAWASHGAASAVTSAAYQLRAKTPVFVPAGGEYSSALQVVIASATPNAGVQYTTDGSEPTASSPTYSPGEVIAVGTTTTLKASAIPQQPSWLPSEVASATYQMRFGIATAPVFSPPPATYSIPLAVSISTIAGGAIHYTTDGSAPTSASPTYAGPINVNSTTTLRAFVVHPDYMPGPKAFATYRLKSPEPVLSVGTGTYAEPQTVTVDLPAWTGSIRYTTNGTEPTLADATVAAGGSILVTHSMPLRVKAFKSGWLPSTTAVANYSIVAEAVGALSATPSGGDYAEPVAVALATTTAGALVRYTLDGSEPTPASAVYSAPLQLTSTTLLRAKAFKGGWAPSPTLAEQYRIDASLIATPVLAPAPGSYATRRNVVATCATPGVTLRYTLDGSEPTETATILAEGAEIPVDHTLRVRVRAFKVGSAPSDSTSGDYHITGAVAGGHGHSLALRADGVLWAWGANEAGQLGLGTTDMTAIPTVVPGLSAVERVAAGRAHSLALTAAGSLWAWGANDNGQLGDGTLESRTTPVQVVGGWTGPIVAIAAGEDFSVALSSDGSLWAWGANADGQLGDGTNQDRSTPVPSATLPNLVSIAAGAGHVLALDGSGHVWSWGRNADGQVGDGTTVTAMQPRSVSLGSPAPTIVSVAAGRAHSMAVTADGALWSWGRDDWGQLGQGEPAPLRASPMLLPEPAEFLAASGGESHSIAIVQTGEALAWGRNDLGQLGDASSTAAPSPQLVIGIEEIASIAAGGRHGLAISADGSLWSWGANESGQLGDGTTTTRRLPVAPILDRLVDNQAVTEDPDLDGLSTGAEYRIGTDPFERDTNGDGVPDGVSSGSGSDPRNSDSDGDGISNVLEGLLGTNPLSADTDGDGFADSSDLFPLDPTRWSSTLPDGADLTAPTITIWTPRHAVRLP